MRFFVVTALSLLACLTAACSEDGRTAGPSTTVTAVNAAPSYPDIGFLREERVGASLSYRGAASFQYEVGQYDFNVDTIQPGDRSPQRELSFSETLQANTDYYFVITESAGALMPIVLAQSPFASTAADAEVAIVHAAPALPALSLYLTAPGADLSVANPVGGLSFTQNLPPQTVPVGEYQFSLTESGNPLNVLYRSPALSFTAGRSHMLLIMDGTAASTVSAVVVLLAGEAFTLIDVNAPSALRVINAPNDLQPRDIVVDDNFAAPLFPALPYSLTDFAPIVPGDRKINVTPAGNPGVIEGENRTTISRGFYYTSIVSGAPGTLKVLTDVENHRRVAGEAHLRLYHAAGQFGNLDFFLLQPGTPITGRIPYVLLPSTAQSVPPLPVGQLELTIRITGTETIVYGPGVVTLGDGGAYSIAAINGATPDTANIALFDDFTP